MQETQADQSNATTIGAGANDQGDTRTDPVAAGSGGYTLTLGQIVTYHLPQGGPDNARAAIVVGMGRAGMPNLMLLQARDNDVIGPHQGVLEDVPQGGHLGCWEAAPLPLQFGGEAAAAEAGAHVSPPSLSGARTHDASPQAHPNVPFSPALSPRQEAPAHAGQQAPADRLGRVDRGADAGLPPRVQSTIGTGAERIERSLQGADTGVRHAFAGGERNSGSVREIVPGVPALDPTGRVPQPTAPPTQAVWEQQEPRGDVASDDAEAGTPENGPETPDNAANAPSASKYGFINPASDAGTAQDSGGDPAPDVTEGAASPEPVEGAQDAPAVPPTGPEPLGGGLMTSEGAPSSADDPNG